MGDDMRSQLGSVTIIVLMLAASAANAQEGAEVRQDADGIPFLLDYPDLDDGQDYDDGSYDGIPDEPVPDYPDDNEDMPDYPYDDMHDYPDDGGSYDDDGYHDMW